MDVVLDLTNQTLTAGAFGYSPRGEKLRVCVESDTETVDLRRVSVHLEVLADGQEVYTLRVPSGQSHLTKTNQKVLALGAAQWQPGQYVELRAFAELADGTALESVASFEAPQDLDPAQEQT